MLWGLGGKELSISEGNLVLLWDHPEGCHKIQDHFKDQAFVIVKWLHKPDAHHIKTVNGDGLEQIMNH